MLNTCILLPLAPAPNPTYYGEEIWSNRQCLNEASSNLAGPAVTGPQTCDLVAGYVGCIRNVRLQNTNLDWTTVLEGRGLGECVSAPTPAPPTAPPRAPCDGNLCAAGSTCRADASRVERYRCDCPSNRRGACCVCVRQGFPL